MPTRSELAEEQRQDQEGLIWQFLLAFWPIFAALDPWNMRDSQPEVAAGLRELTRRFGSQSAYAARLWYEQARADAGLTNPYRLPIVDPPSQADIDRTFRALTADLWVPDGADRELVEVIKTETADALSDALSDLVLGTGREQTVEAIDRDRSPRIRYARVAEPDACAFCMMLATRGAVYRSSETAGDRIDRYHPNCRCDVVAVFGRWDEPDEVRRARELYERVTQNVGGRGKARAFRRAWERPHIERNDRGEDVRRAVEPEVRRKPKVYDTGNALDSLDWVENQISVTETLKDSEWRTRQLARLRKRASELRAA